MSFKARLKSVSRIAAIALISTFGSSLYAVPIAGQGTWESTLQARDLNGDGITNGFYDTTLNVTWASNADINGRMTWDTAMAWAGGFSIGNVSGWRLPTMVDSGAPGCDPSFAGGTDCRYNVQTLYGGITYSEMAHLYYVTLGNLSICPPDNPICSAIQVDFGLRNTGNFQKFQKGEFWTNLEYVSPASGSAWRFGTYEGFQTFSYKGDLLYGLAVRSGDAGAAIPVPVAPTALLLLPLLAGLASRSGRQTG